MSSGLGEGGLLGVGVEGSVDDVGEFAFEGAEGFSFSGTGFESAVDERLGSRVHAGLGDGDAVEGGVGLPVPAPVQPAALVVG